MVIVFACEPVPGVGGSDAFTHMIVRFPKGQMWYPEVPPPQGIIVEAVDDTTLSVRCAKPGTVYVTCGDFSPFGNYLRSLESRPGVQPLVAGIYFDTRERKAWSEPDEKRVRHVPDIALAMGGPEVHVQEYGDYPHKDKPHRLLVPAGCNVVCTINGVGRWSCASTEFHTLYPRGMPIVIPPHRNLPAHTWVVTPGPRPEPDA